MADNKALSQADKDVPADSSPAPVDDHATDNDPTPVPPAGNQDGKGDDGEDGSKNVRAEMNRKFGKMDERFARMEGMLEGIAARHNSAQPAQPDSPPTDLAAMSSTQLESLRPNIPEDKLPALDQLIAQRKMDERVDAQVSQRWAENQLREDRKKYNQIAYDRYPELRIPNSPVRSETNRVLDEMGSGADASPRSVLDAANEAASRLGIKPLTGVHHAPHTPRPGGRNAPVNGGPAGDDGGGDYKPDPERLKQLGAKLAGALPGGKGFSDEAMKRIAERSAEYQKHKHLYVKT